MPVQDHPLYNDWSFKLDLLKEANDCYRAAIVGRLDQHAIRSLRFNLDNAQREFNEVANVIDT